MKNFVHKGEVMPYTAPSGGVVSGRAYLIGGLLVVATMSAAEGEVFQGLVQGVVRHAKADEAWTEGLKIYWDDTAKVMTSVASGNTLVGVAVRPLAAAVVVIASDALAADLLISGLTLQVLDFAALAGATITVTVDGVETILTEGVDFDAEVDDDTTADNIAAAIDAIDGVSATAATDTVTVLAATGSEGDEAVGSVRLDGATR